jgi:SAM-dependent methyltransferase
MYPLKSLGRKVFPRPLWRWLGRQAKDLPFRLRDFGPDLREQLSSSASRPPLPPLPPAALRRRVGLTSSRDEFLTVGRNLSQVLLAAFEEQRRPDAGYPRWLDFGCGSGRLARFLPAAGVAQQVYGVDVDRAAIRWARRHLGKGFVAIEPRPPLPFPEAAFDVAYAISVFTHFDEATQLAWLQELRRVLRPGGFLIASTHHADLQWTRPDLSEEQRARLAAHGFLFAPGGGLFNDNSTFHTLPYLEATWGSLFEPKSYAKHGFGGYQDLSLWEARAP